MTSVKPQATVTASSLTDESAFDTLAGEWDSLLDRSDQCSFFLRLSWCRLWWHHLRPADSQLFIICCRDRSGRLVGLAPFYLKQRRTAGIPHVREINFLGTGVYAHTSERLDIVAERGYESVVAESIASFLRNENGWERLWLNEVPSSSIMLESFRRAIGGAHEISVCSRSLYVDTTLRWEDYLKTLNRSTRHNLRRRTRNAMEELDYKSRLVETLDELEPAMDALIKLHQARWVSKGEPGSFALPGVEEFLKEVMRVSFAEGRLWLWTFATGDHIVSVRQAFFDNNTMYGFQGGFDPAYSRYSVGSIQMALCLKDCIEDERVFEYDFLSGDEGYKKDWAKLARESVCLTILRSNTRSWAYAGVEQAKRISKSLVRATVPAPIRAAGHRFIQKRHYVK